MNKNKYLTILVGLLASLNIAILCFIMFQKPPKHNFRPDRHPKEKDLLHDLGFNEDQVIAFEESKEQYILESRQLNKELNIASKKYYQADTKDSIRAILHKDIMRLTDNIYKVNLKHFDDLRSLCAPNQKNKMEEFVTALVDRKSRNHPKRKRK